MLFTFYELMTVPRRSHHSEVKDALWLRLEVPIELSGKISSIATNGSPAAGRPGICPIASATNLGTDGRRRVTCHAAPFGPLYACPQNEFEAQHLHYALLLPGAFFPLVPAASQDRTLLILQKLNSQAHWKDRTIGAVSLLAESF
jgi:hypothetical protein